MGSSQTGLNPDKVNGALRVAARESNAVMDKIQQGFDNLLKGLKENWGTQDGKVWVEGECCSAIDKMTKQVSETLSKIAEVINKVALAQIGDTKNTQSVDGPTATKVVNNKIDMNDKLSNGYIGVFDELKGDLAKDEADLIAKFQEAMGKLQSNVIAETDKAFNLVGQADKVSAECTIYINQAMNVIKKGLDNLNNDITTQVAKADTYVKDIQNAGLRGATNNASSGGSNGGPTASTV